MKYRRERPGLPATCSARSLRRPWAPLPVVQPTCPLMSRALAAKSATVTPPGAMTAHLDHRRLRLGHSPGCSGEETGSQYGKPQKRLPRLPIIRQ